MVSARFKDGVFEASDNLAQMMLAHPAFGSDFISAQETMGTDPFAYMREGSEPEHLVTEMKYGQPVGPGKAPAIKFTPEVRKALQDQAMEMAKVMAEQMAPIYAAKYVEKLVADREATKVATDTAENTVVTEKPKTIRTGKAQAKTQAE